MHTYLIDMLECPACHGELAWHVTEWGEKRIETGDVRCTECAASYPVWDGVGVFLLPDLPRNDLWDQAGNELIGYLREHPDVEGRLTEPPLEVLSPADRFYRALVLEAREDYAAAKAAEDSANRELYTPEYLACRDSQVNYLINQVSRSQGPIVDLASGRCYLVEGLARRLDHPIVATDFSPVVLRRDKRWLEFFGLYDRISLLAFDARHTPFKDGVVPTLTTNLGLPNIEEPGSLLEELRRIVAGRFLAISHFYPEDDTANRSAIREAELEELLYRRTALERFGVAGWEVAMENACSGTAEPTPAGMVLEGAKVDGLPVTVTELEWCVLVATSRMH
jgi:uncharacterized protein YbaR (Trm112 family)